MNPKTTGFHLIPGNHIYHMGHYLRGGKIRAGCDPPLTRILLGALRPFRVLILYVILEERGYVESY